VDIEIAEKEMTIVDATLARSAAAPPAPRREAQNWPLERILFALAGTMTGLSAVLAVLVSPWFLLLTGFVALNQLAFASFGHCGASLILERGFGVRRSVDR
jgi:fatty acid desaturase